MPLSIDEIKNLFPGMDLDEPEDSGQPKTPKMREEILAVLAPRGIAQSPAGQAFIHLPTACGTGYAAPLLSDSTFSWLNIKLDAKSQPLATWQQFRTAAQSLAGRVKPTDLRRTFSPRVIFDPNHRIPTVKNDPDGTQTFVYESATPQPAYVLSLDTKSGYHVAITNGEWLTHPSHNPPLYDPIQRNLPRPTPNQTDLTPLRQLLNLDQPAQDATWNTLVDWMQTALRPAKNPAFHEYPILNLMGPGKTTAAKILTELLDPTAEPVHALPSTERKLHNLAGGHHILVFDNPGKINPEKSRHLSRLSTGIASLHRKLEGTLVRPIILTTREETETRHLATRIVDVELPAIENPLSPQEIEAKLTAIRPQIQGALFTLLAANFEKPAPCRPNRQTKNQKIEQSVIAFLQSNGGAWQGTATQLHEALNVPISVKALSLLLDEMDALYAEHSRTSQKRLIHLRLKTKSQETPESVIAPEKPANVQFLGTVCVSTPNDTRKELGDLAHA